MRGAEGVVDVKLAECGQPPGEVRVVFRLSRMEADVLQHHDLAVAHRHHGGLDRRTNAIVEMAHGAVDQLAEPLGQRRGPIGVIDLAVRAAEVRDHDHPRIAFDQVLDGWDRLPDPGIVDDPAVLCGDIEVDADQHAPAGDVDVANRGFLQRPAADRLLRLGLRVLPRVGSQFSRSPMNTVRSTTRQEYPHSLSYQAKTLP